MTPNPHVPPFARHNPMTLPQRLALSPQELARKSVRRRLLKYLVETQHRRAAARRCRLPMENA